MADGTKWNTYSVIGESFELPETFNVVDYLGSGAYGTVCAAGCSEMIENNEPCIVAIKKCKNIFSSKTLVKRTLREARLLRVLSNHPNIIKLIRVLMPRYTSTFNSLYLVFQMMETDLASIIRSAQQLTDEHVRYFSVQLLRACDFLHHNDIVHRDIKPRNILVNGDCTLRVADFGLGRVHTPNDDSNTVAMTAYVTTRWYRAPEILVGWGKYGVGIDMWAVGCVIAELVGRVPFFPGGDSKKQLDLIVNVLGRPDEGFISQIRKPACRDLLAALPVSAEFSRKNLKDVIGKGHAGAKAPLVAAEEITPGVIGVSPDVLVLIDGLLVWEPQERLTAKDCLQSPYFNSSAPQMASFGSTNGETDCSPYTLNIQGDITAEFAFEHRKMTFDELRSELLGEAKQYSESIEAVHKSALAIEMAYAAGAPTAASVAAKALSPLREATDAKAQLQTAEASEARAEGAMQSEPNSEETKEKRVIMRPNFYCVRSVCADPNDFAYEPPNIDTNDPRRLANSRVTTAPQGSQQVTEVAGCAIL